MCVSKAYADEESRSEISFGFVPVYNFDFNAASLNMDVAYRPWGDSGCEFGLGAAYTAGAEYELEQVSYKHDESNVNLYVGYAWKPIEMLDIKASIGASSAIEDVEDSLIEQGNTSGFVGLDLAFKLNENWHLVNRFNYNLGHENNVDSGSFGFGFKYVFGGSPVVASSSLNDDSDIGGRDRVGTLTPSAELPDEQTELTQTNEIVAQSDLTPLGDLTLQEQPVHIAEPIIEPIVEPEPEPETTSYYSVQLGSFDKQASIDAFLQRSPLSQADVFYRPVNAVIKLNTGKFSSRNEARNKLTDLKRQGLNGFVVFIKE